MAGPVLNETPDPFFGLGTSPTGPVHRSGDQKEGPVAPGPTCAFSSESGRGDLNPRPPAPKAGALPGCATPRIFPGLTWMFSAQARSLPPAQRSEHT